MKKSLSTFLFLSSMIGFSQAQATTWFGNIPDEPESNPQGTTVFQQWSDETGYRAKVIAGKINAQSLQADVSRESDRCTGGLTRTGNAVVIHDESGRRVFQKLLVEKVTFGEFAVVYDHC